MDRQNRCSIPHRMERAGYMLVRNPDAPKDGYWTLPEGRRPIYGRNELSRAGTAHRCTQAHPIGVIGKHVNHFPHENSI